MGCNARMRCFLAIELPDAVRQRLAALQTQLRELDRAVRWTRPEQIHLTLKFLGDVPDPQIARVCEVVRTTLAARGCFELEVQGVGCFPPQGPPRIVWAGLAGPPAELVSMYESFEVAFGELGYPPEGRAFRPHLTLGRTRDRSPVHAVRPALHGLVSFSAGAFTVRQLVLFESVLGRGGATHTPLMRAELAGE